MIDIVNGIGSFINGATKVIMGVPNQPLPPQQIIKLNNVPCTNCGQNTSANQPNNNGIIFNADKSNTSARGRINPELELNLRNTPYTNTTGVKFN